MGTLLLRRKVATVNFTQERAVYRLATKILQRNGWVAGQWTAADGSVCMGQALFNACSMLNYPIGDLRELLILRGVLVRRFSNPSVVAVNDRHIRTINDAIEILQTAADIELTASMPRPAAHAALFVATWKAAFKDAIARLEAFTEFESEFTDEFCPVITTNEEPQRETVSA